jgi:hypothetical protein
VKLEQANEIAVELLPGRCSISQFCAKVFAGRAVPIAYLEFMPVQNPENLDMDGAVSGSWNRSAP